MELLQDVCREVVAVHGDLVAFDSGDSQATFNEFFARTESLSGALADLGIKKGDRVAILAHNCMDYVSYHYATAMIGAMLVPLNIRHTDEEMLWILNDSEPSVIVLDEKLIDHLGPLRAGCPHIKFTIGLAPNQETDFLTEDLIKGNLPAGPYPSPSENDTVLLIYTSGTTGRPKGAFHTHKGSNIIDRLTAEAMEISEEDVYLAFMPFFHQAGLIRTRAIFTKGGTNLVAGKMDIGGLVTLLIEKKVSITMLVPPIDVRLSDIADEKGLSFPYLRLILGGGGMGPLHAGRMKKFCDKFKCRYAGLYGQTETTGPVTYVTGDVYFQNPYTLGKPIEGIEIEIWDQDNRHLPPGSVGEIMVRSKNTSPGYWKNDQANRELYTGDWLHTGDLGKADAEGLLYFADRKKELIKTGGENVYPKEVENVLEKHPAISEVSVIGLPDPEGWGEIVTAVVVLELGAALSLDDVKTFCNGRIAGYKIPKEISFVDQIPRNFSGKPMKAALKKSLMHEKIINPS